MTGSVQALVELFASTAQLLDEIARGRCVSSRGRFNPRGVKRKMSNFNGRHRGASLNQRHQPVPTIRI